MRFWARRRPPESTGPLLDTVRARQLAQQAKERARRGGARHHPAGGGGHIRLPLPRRAVRHRGPYRSPPWSRWPSSAGSSPAPAGGRSARCCSAASTRNGGHGRLPHPAVHDRRRGARGPTGGGAAARHPRHRRRGHLDPLRPGAQQTLGNRSRAAGARSSCPTALCWAPRSSRCVSRPPRTSARACAPAWAPPRCRRCSRTSRRRCARTRISSWRTSNVTRPWCGRGNALVRGRRDHRPPRGGHERWRRQRSRGGSRARPTGGRPPVEAGSAS